MSNQNIEIISLGSNCAVKMSAQVLNPSQAAYPFDWLITNDLNQITHTIKTKNIDYFTSFETYKISFGHSNHPVTPVQQSIIDKIDKSLLIAELKDPSKPVNPESFNKIFGDPSLYKVIVSILTKGQTILVHDHHVNISWNEVKEKYLRRFERFFSLSPSQPILFVRFSEKTDPINNLIKVLEENYKNFHLLILFYDKNLQSEAIYSFNKITDRCYSYTGKLIFDSRPFYSNIYKRFIEEIIKN